MKELKANILFPFPTTVVKKKQLVGLHFQFQGFNGAVAEILWPLRAYIGSSFLMHFFFHFSWFRCNFSTEPEPRTPRKKTGKNPEPT